jgi:putative ABC transport system permease protein
VLVGIQVALAVVLLVGAALFLQTLRSAVAFRPGIEPNGLTIASVELRGQRYAGAARGAFYARLRDELAADAGVAAVSFAGTLPLAGRIGRRGVRFEGYTLSPGEDREMPVNFVDRDFFRTMRGRLIAGREFGPQETATSEPVAIVSDALSRRYFKGAAVGRHIRMSDGRLRTIIGIAGDIKYRDVRESPLPVVYLALAQEPQLRATMLVRARDEGVASERTLREAVRRVDADLPVFGAQTMREYLSMRAGQERLIATLLAVCGAAALLLAGIGVYGVTAYGATRRTREFGIRMALGATPAGIRRIVLLQTVRMTIAGVAAGALASWLLGPLVESALFGTTAANPAATIGAAAALVVIALVASYVPARRATRVDPVVALRAE